MKLCICFSFIHLYLVNISDTLQINFKINSTVHISNYKHLKLDFVLGGKNNCRPFGDLEY